MYQALQLFTHKGIKKLYLLDLSKINIICGKNNSGKSSILEAIKNPSNSLPGININDQNVPGFFKEVVSTSGWRGDFQNSVENKALLKIIKEIVALKEYWFYNDFDEFRNTFAQKFANDPSLRTWQPPHLEYVFESRFKKRYNTILIPPKRITENTTSINTSIKALENGDGVLNRLFTAQTQTKDHELYRNNTKLKETFKKISEGYDYSISTLENNHINLNFEKDDHIISAGSCGLGLHELLVILFFAIFDKSEVMLLEEPEIHLHPEMQKKLINFLATIDKQIFISTHSNVFLNNANVDRIYHTSYSDKQIFVKDETKIASILNDLGYSIADNLVSDLIILVEGPTDVPVWQEILTKKGLMEKYNIKFWPLGGDIMDQLDLTVFSESFKIIAIIDSDPHSGHIRANFEKKCAEHRIRSFKLHRYAIENYFPLDVLKEQFKNQIDDTIIELNPSIKLEDQIKLNVKKSNRMLAKAMTLNEVEDTDIKIILQEITKYLEA